MDIKLSFLGAAQNVTGSRHLLQANAASVLIDCGLYQERHFRDRNWDPFPSPPTGINAVLLTHAHLDHCGLLPKLVREGFKGKIYCTNATAEIAQIILLDSAKIQVEDAEFKRKRHEKEGRKGPRPEQPLYTIEDAEKCFPLFSPVEYKKIVNIADGIEASFHDAGHVLGSSIIKLKVTTDNEQRTILFSGDIGRTDRPIVHDPALFEQADYVLIESTYGDRVHKDHGDIKEQIAEAINSAKKAGGNVIVPSFALERAQDILYYLNELIQANEIPRLSIFLDSPMASRITEVFKKHPELFDDETTEMVSNHHSPFNLPGLQVTGSSEDSKAINNIKDTIMVIAGSGMCTGGRIKHHLVNNISRPQNTIMFVGYQAVGTLGRHIVDGAEQARILGRKYDVKAKIVKINGFSAHADRDELLNWLKAIKKPPRRVFVVHGEFKSANKFGSYIKEQTGWNVTVPAYQDQVTLD